MKESESELLCTDSTALYKTNLGYTVQVNRNATQNVYRQINLNRQVGPTEHSVKLVQSEEDETEVVL
jgi:hypothetical protein